MTTSNVPARPRASRRGIGFWTRITVAKPMHPTNTKTLSVGRSGILLAIAVTVAACTSQLAGLAGGPGSTSSVSDATSPSAIASLSSSTAPVSAAPGSGTAGSGLGSPGSRPSPNASSGGSSGSAPDGPLVCPADATATLGSMCAPASDLLDVSAAAAILTTTERAAGTRGWLIHGATPCASSPSPVGCTTPNLPQGEVIIEFKSPVPTVHILVFRRTDGSLGATRLG